MALCPSCVRSSVSASVNSSFKRLLLRNHWLDFYQISQECSLGGPLSNSFKLLCSMKNPGCHSNQSKKPIKNLLLPNHLLDCIIILQECSLDRGLQDSFTWKWSVKKHGFYGRPIFLLLWYRVKWIYKVFRLVQVRLLLLDYLK